MAALLQPTLQQLLFNVRNFLNQPDPNNSSWSDAELTGYLNEAIRRYFGEVVQSSEGLFTKQTDLDITAGNETIALPSDFFEVVRLYKKVNNEYISLYYDNSSQQNYTTDGPSSSTAAAFSYYLRGDDLVLRNTPQFTETGGLRLEYIYFPETMVNGGDSMTTQVAPVFKDLIEMYAVYKAKLKESVLGHNVDMVSRLQGHVGDLYKQFQDVIAQRSHGISFVKPFDPFTGD